MMAVKVKVNAKAGLAGAWYCEHWSQVGSVRFVEVLVAMDPHLDR